jgi:hypothetical protein
VLLAWSQKVAAPLRGLALARERGWVLAWDAEDRLHLWDRDGRPQAHRRMAAPVAAAAAADDGSHFAAVGRHGQVWLLTPDLAVCRERAVGGPATAVALDPFGRHLGVADGAGRLHLLGGDGRALWTTTTPRPLRHLAFVPERPVVVGSADFGLVVCLDAAGALLWRDGLVATVGSLAVSGDGAALVLACYSDGLYCYGVDRPRPQRLPSPADAAAGACHLAAVSYSGDALLVAGLENRITLTNRAGTVLGQHVADGPVVGLILGPLGDYAVAALGEGMVLGLIPHGEPAGAG